MLTGDIIRLQRTKKGLSQEQLAYYAGVSIKTIQRAEKNTNISVESLRGIAAAFDMDIDVFLSDKKHLGLIKEEFTRQADKIKNSKFFNYTFIKEVMFDLANFEKEDIVLDLGCGPGILSREISRIVSKVYAVDITEKMLSVNKSNSEMLGINNIEYIKSNAIKMPFENKSIDKVIMRLSFHHFSDVSKVLEEIRRVLKKDGMIIIGDIISSEDKQVRELHNAIEKLRDPTHVKAYSKNELTMLVKQNSFKVVAYEEYSIEREYDEWLDITNNPERYEPLLIILKNYLNYGVDTGMNLGQVGEKIFFKHRLLFMKLKVM